MQTKMRMYQGEEDYWRLRAFLRDVFLLNDHREFCWQVARLDYWRYFGNEHIEHYVLKDTICIWEEDGRIIAFITPESRGHAYLQIHPEYYSDELEYKMLSMAEQLLAEIDEDEKHHITAWAHQNDEARKQVLRERGYKRGDWHEHQFRRCLDTELPDVRLAEEYLIRSLGDTSELPARSWLSWRVFHPDEPTENYQGWQWYADVQRCPLYRRDLDLVAVAPNGELAAFCTVWYDDVTRTGYFEPVGTSSNHQRKGLGKAIMTEGLHRLKHMGALYATVAGYSDAAIALYSSIISPKYFLYERWQKQWSAD